MMDNTERYVHRMLAEDGIEKTPREIRKLCRAVKRAVKSLSRRTYERYRLMSIVEKRREARDLGLELDDFLGLHDTIVYIGKKKFGE